MTNNIKILFWIHKSKLNKKGEAPLYLRLTYNNVRKNLSSGYSIHPDRWDAQKGAIKGSKKDAVLMNTYISHTKEKLLELFNNMLKEQDINLELLVDKFFGRDIDNRSLLELVNYHNKDFESRIGTDYTYSTFEKYDILYRKLLNFIPYKYARKDIRLKDLNNKFLTDFDFYLKVHDKNEHNTATKYIKNLKKIINLGIREGWLDTDPFKHFQASYKDIDRVYLTQYELDIIQAKEFKLTRLGLVKDMFLFQCYTGFAYSDMAKLTLGHIVPGIDGGKWIITRRQKTKVRAAVPLLSEADRLISKYNKEIDDLAKPIFDFYSIQRFNTYLHEIAEICGINKNLTSHVGRRTFATTIALSNGIGLETISKILGHTTTKITAQYAVVTDMQISKDMKSLEEKLKKRRGDY